MIDIKELRRLAQAAVNVPDGVSLTWIKHLQDFQQEVGATVVLELLDRLEAAETDALEQARVNGMGSEREASLMAKLESAKKERDTLLSIVDKFGDGIDWIQRALQAEAEIEVMRQQEPVAEVGQQYSLLFVGGDSITGIVERHGLKVGDKLYALPLRKRRNDDVATD